MRQPHRSRASSWLFVLALAASAGCGSSSSDCSPGQGIDGGNAPDVVSRGGDAAGLKNLSPSNGGSGIDLSSYPTQSPLGPTGGSLPVPGGPTLTVAPGVLGSTATVGVRAATSAPTVGAPGYTVLSPWYDLATSTIETVAATGAITLDVPASPPASAISHP